MSTNGLRIVAIGELLWDLLPAGKQLGGAPANFAYFTQALGAHALLISRVGDDLFGDEALERIEELGLSTAGVTRDPEHETGKASVELDAAGAAHFAIHEPAAWDFLQSAATFFEAAAQAHAVCFGTLGRRSPASRGVIRETVLRSASQALRVLDLNLRAPFYGEELIVEGLQLANVLKLNEDELKIVSEMLRLTGGETERLRELQRRFELHVIALTKGEAGSVLLRGAEISQKPARRVEVADTIGAGDSFTAAMVMGLLQQLPLDELHARAARLAAYVCERPGATPPLLVEWIEARDAL